MDTVEFFWDYSPREQGNFTFNKLDFFLMDFSLLALLPLLLSIYLKCQEKLY